MDASLNITRKQYKRESKIQDAEQGIARLQKAEAAIEEDVADIAVLAS